MSAHTCKFCNDTGMSHGSSELDCTRCDAAIERIQFHNWAAGNLTCTGSEENDWAIYQYGKAAGAATSAWMDIATAPLDGTEIRLLCEDGEDVGHFDIPLNPDGYTESWRGTLGEWSTKLGNGTPLKWRGIAGATIPSGWTVGRQHDGDIIVAKPGLGGYVSRKNADISNHSLYYS